jgi:LmbE family N-acetylglucosaminyl deacetylase
MTRAELTAACAALGWSKRHLARVLGVPETTALGWGGKGRAVPEDVVGWLEALLITQEVTMRRYPPPRREPR